MIQAKEKGKEEKKYLHIFCKLYTICYNHWYRHNYINIILTVRSEGEICEIIVKLPLKRNRQYL